MNSMSANMVAKQPLPYIDTIEDFLYDDLFDNLTVSTMEGLREVATLENSVNGTSTRALWERIYGNFLRMRTNDASFFYRLILLPGDIYRKF